MIDTSYENALYLVIRSIYELRFNPKDIRYIIHTHWHGDHTAATSVLVDLSRAKTLIGWYDKKIKQFFIPDWRGCARSRWMVFIGNPGTFLDFCESRLDRLIENKSE